MHLNILLLMIKNKDPTVIVNEFNKYFVNIGQSLAEKIIPTHDFNFYLKNRIDSQLRFTLVDEEHIVGIFNRLKISQVMVVIIYQTNCSNMQKPFLLTFYTLMTYFSAVLILLLTRFTAVLIRSIHNSTHRLYPCIILTHKRTHYFCACVKLSRGVFRCCSGM